MSEKILFFSIDRLGDFLIRSSVIKKISENYKYNEIICSDINSKLISTQSYFNKIFIFDKKKKILNKIYFVKKFFLSKYDSVIVFDGKSFSNFLLLFIKANFKYTFIYKKTGTLNLVKFNFMKFLLNIFKIKYTILHSRDIIESDHEDHYPSKYKSLKKYYKNISDDTYYLEELGSELKLKNFSEYILIHFDEKMDKIKNIDTKLSQTLNQLSINTNKKIIISCFNYSSNFFLNLKFKIYNYKDLFNETKINEKIIIIKDTPLDYFYILIKNSFVNISAHAGFVTHTSFCLNKNCIDIISTDLKRWLNAWIQFQFNYFQIFMDTKGEKKDILDLFKDIEKKVNEL